MKINKNNYVIGITGGVGAGKSTVLYILENTFGAHVYQADRVSRSLTLSDGPAFEPVVGLFGKDILTEAGDVDREKLSKIVFSDAEKLAALESIIHPEVRRFLWQKAETRDGLVVFEAALPKEGGFEDICDEIWYIHADAETRIDRLVNSRGYSREKALDVMASQLTDEQFREICQVVIENNGCLEELEAQISEQIKRIKSIFKGQN